MAPAPSRSAARVWAPVVLFLVLTLALHVTMAGSHNALPQYGDARWVMKTVPLIALIGVVVMAIASRRTRAPFWLAPSLATATTLVGLFGAWQAMARVRLYLGQPQSWPEQSERIFVEAAAESLSSPTLGAIFGASLLSAAGLGLAFHARASADRAKPFRGRAWATFAGILGFVGLCFAYGTIGLVRAEALVAPALAAISIVSVLLAARSLLDDPLGHRRTDVMEVALHGVAAVALAGIASVLLAVRARWGAWGGEAVDPDQKARIFAEVPLAIGNEVAIALLSVGAIALVTILLVLPRQAPVQRSLLHRSVVLLGTVGVVCAALWAQIRAFEDERPETRMGEPCEFVVDRHYPAGALAVDLDRVSKDLRGPPPAQVRLSNGTVRPWTEDEPAVFEGIAVGEEVSFTVEGPYRARNAGFIRMPASKGVRVRVPVLSLAPDVTNAEYEPERVMHIDITDPTRFRLAWASGRLIQTSQELPRDTRALSAEVRKSWQESGSHRSEYDSRLDTAVIHHPEGAGFGELQDVASAVLELQRVFKGENVAAFQVFVVPMRREPVSLDKEADPAFWQAQGSAQERIERIRAALVKCGGQPCAIPSNADQFGVEFGRACDRLRCTVATMTALWSDLGESLAGQGNRAASESSFRRAVLLTPGWSLRGEASGEARAAYESARRNPMANVRRGAITINGRITPDAVAAALSGREGPIRVCYEDGLRNNPRLQGRVSLRFVIGRDGAISNIGNGGSDLPDSSVVSCVIKAAWGLSFRPPEGGIATVVVPFMFGG